MNERPTPETDAYIGEQNEGLMTEGEFAMCQFARMLERDRDEALDLLASEKSTRNAIILKGEEMEKQIEAMREAIREAHSALSDLVNLGSLELPQKRDDALLKGSAAIDILKPFIKP